MAKNINILLRLKDKFSKPLQGTTKQIREQQRQINKATKVIQGYGNKANKVFKNVAKVAAGTASLLGGLTVKTAFGEAMDLEGYKMQLETATKDTQKASEIMQYAIDLANKTPFEGGALVEGAAKFEAMGLSAKKWLTFAGDMAAATNKDFDQSVEALIDAQAGELERLKEFGITKAMILEKGEELFTGVQIANNKGQIVNQEKFNEAMLALMSEKFSGGMEKQATTVQGLWSTITGVTKNALANIIGMQNDGTIQAGSLLDRVKEKVGELAEKLQQWQNDGTIQAIADKAGTAFDAIADAIGWVVENINLLLPVLSGLSTGFMVFNLAKTVAPFVMALASAISGASTATAVFNALMKNNPIGLVATAIGILITLITLLIANWDKVKEVVQRVVGAVVGFITTLKDAIVQLATEIKDGIVGAFEWVKKKVKGIFDWFKEQFGWIGDAVNGLVDKVSGGASWVKDKFSGLFGGGEDGHATGTTYFQGGRTRINEGGRGEIVDLPSGTRIIPHDVAKEEVKAAPSVTVSLTVQGNVIGNRDYMEEVGAYIARKVLLAQGVV